MTALLTTREQRRRKLGIDCPDRVCWKNWEAGEEYVRRLVIKNVEGRAQTITYGLPERKTTFLTPYPQPVMLSSGMSFELEIRFCPTEVVEINDLLEVTVVGRGSFVVYLECLTPFAKMSTPKAHDFELCAVDVTVQTQTTIENTGTVPLQFYWEVPMPFAISPSVGALNPGESMEVTLLFTPREAAAVMCQAICKMENLEEVIAIMRLSGIGKYPYVRFVYADPAFADIPTAAAPGKARPPHRADSQHTLTPLTAATASLNFKELLAGGSAASELLIENPSAVPAQVSLQRRDDGLICPFTVTPASCVIPRGGSQKFRVVFKAKGAGALHRNRFEWAALAGNTIGLEVKGVVVGPSVKTSTSHINFGDVQLEKMPPEKGLTRFVQLKNVSDSIAHFQFVSTSPGAAFHVEPSVGSIPARGNVKVKVRFQPSLPMNYLRRLVALVEGAADALFVDVFGSAYNNESRPLPFDLTQVEAFYLRLDRGMGRCTPEELEAVATAVLRDRDPLTEEDSHVQNIWRAIAQDASNTVTGMYLQKRTGRLPYSRLLPRDSSGAGPFSLEASTLVFGARSPAVQTVTVTNSSEAMATAAWCVPVGSPYAVVPQYQDISAGGFATFQVTCKGIGSGNGAATASTLGTATLSLSAQCLECYVNYKQMRSFRLVNENSFTPPHCLTVQCCQESPADTGPGAVATASLVNVDALISFPTSRVGDSTYQVVALENTGDAVQQYAVQKIVLHDMSEKVADDVTVMVTTVDGAITTTVQASGRAAYGQPQQQEGGAEVFRCFPSTGLLHPRQRVLMLVEFCPDTLARYEADATLAFNNSLDNTAALQFRGESCIPRLIVENARRQITFRPTCITGETRTELQLLNPTSMSISFRFCPCEELMSVLRFEPSSGVLHGGQRMRLAALFCPEQPRVYEGHVALVLRDDQEPSGSPLLQRGGGISGRSSVSSSSDMEMQPAPLSYVSREYVMSTAVVGEGMHGLVEVEPVTMDCGAVAGLEPQTVSLTLYNSGMCEVQYEVRAMMRTEPAEWRHVAELPRLRNHTGTLPARTHAAVLVTVQPSAGLSEYVLYAMVCGVGTNIHSVDSPASMEEALQHPHCTLTIRGTRPAIQITDARSLTVQKSHLWSQLCINKINSQLAAAVKPHDVEKTSFAFAQYIEGLVPVTLDLGVGHPQMATMAVSLKIENAGDCPADFTFWMPTDKDVHEETWFVPDEQLRDIQCILDKSIIEVMPRRGTIPVGGSAVVTIHYRFHTVGVHTLPVLLRVSDGKKVLMVLEGRTLPHEMNAVGFHHSSMYELMPVALGDVEPPMQSMVIENPLDREVEYIVDVEALRGLAGRNYGFPILQCVTPTGVLAPRSVAQLLWYFRPLEAKEYTISVPISVTDGESYALTFVGAGYHPRKTPADAVRAMIARSFLALPAAPTLSLSPTLPVALSLDVCHLGAVPYFSLHRRSCAIANQHPSHTYFFQWDTCHAYGDHSITVQPASGLLLPGERAECRIAVYSGSTSQLVEWPAICHITNETLLEREAQQQHSKEGLLPDGSEEDDGGEQRDAAGGGGGFKRSTCTKQRSTSSKDVNRQSVTVVPLESLGVRALAARMATARRLQDQAEWSAAHQHDGDPVVWNALELLIQARVMPLEEYERVYGAQAVQHTHFPALNVFADPMRGVVQQKPDMEEITFVRDVLDELLRTVVALPLVQTAFTEPLVRGVTRYRDLITSSAASDGAAAARVEAKGYVSNVVEEALNELLYSVAGAVTEAVSLQTPAA